MKTLLAKGRSLFWSDSTPFFYLGDTAWELLHRLNREEIEEYIPCPNSSGSITRAKVIWQRQAE